MRHCAKRDHYLHFRKCKLLNCEHCHNTVKDPSALELLDLFEEDRCLPIPFLFKTVNEGKHFPALLDLISNADLLKVKIISYFELFLIFSTFSIFSIDGERSNNYRKENN